MQLLLRTGKFSIIKHLFYTMSVGHACLPSKDISSSRQNPKGYGWRKQYIVNSTRRKLLTHRTSLTNFIVWSSPQHMWDSNSQLVIDTHNLGRCKFTKYNKITVMTTPKMPCHVQLIL
jgi:hypothetical protein